MNIGEASKRSGVSQRMIRHYEGIGLIARAARRESGYRDYGENDVHTLRFIRRARDLGFPIEEIGQLLALRQDQSRASADVKALALARAGQLKRTELELRAHRPEELRRMTESLAREGYTWEVGEARLPGKPPVTYVLGLPGPAA